MSRTRSSKTLALSRRSISRVTVGDPSRTISSEQSRVILFSAPLRFDLFFILRDDPEDLALNAKITDHIIKQHAYFDDKTVTGEEAKVNEDGAFPNVTRHELGMYIRSAQRFNPIIDSAARYGLSNKVFLSNYQSFPENFPRKYLYPRVQAAAADLSVQ